MAHMSMFGDIRGLKQIVLAGTLPLSSAKTEIIIIIIMIVIVIMMVMMMMIDDGDNTNNSNNNNNIERISIAPVPVKYAQLRGTNANTQIQINQEC